jgi:flagellar protein FliS
LNTLNPLNAYKETQIKTANQGKLIVMLYDGAIKNLNLAVKSFSSSHRKYDVISNAILKAQDIISELMVSLDFDKGGEISRNLFSLYTFMNNQLLNANLKKERKPVEEVKKMLMELREAWAEIAAKGAVQAGSTGENGVNIAG